jgi:Mg-chelatase subunit ChlD
MPKGDEARRKELRVIVIIASALFILGGERASAQSLSVTKSSAENWPKVKVTFDFPQEGETKEQYQLTPEGSTEAYLAKSLFAEKRDLNGARETLVAVDTSKTISQDYMAKTREALAYYAEKADPSELTALVTFDDEARLASDFSSDRKSFAFALEGLKPSGVKTELYKSILFGLDLLKNRKGNKLLIVVSDGRDEGTETSYFDVLDSALINKIKITSIALPTAKNSLASRHSVLEYLSRETDGDYYEAKTAEDISRAFHSVLRSRGGAGFSYSLFFDIDPDYKPVKPEIKAVLSRRSGSSAITAELTLRPPEEFISSAADDQFRRMENILDDEKNFLERFLAFFGSNTKYLMVLASGAAIIILAMALLARRVIKKQREALVNHTNVLNPYFVPLKPPVNDESPYELYFPNLKKRHRLKLGSNSIGASKNNDLTLNIDTLSGNHAELFVTPTECLIKDLNSTNGTLVNGISAIERTSVQEGDAIRFANISAILTRKD